MQLWEGDGREAGEGGKEAGDEGEGVDVEERGDEGKEVEVVVVRSSRKVVKGELKEKRKKEKEEDHQLAKQRGRIERLDEQPQPQIT